VRIFCLCFLCLFVFVGRLPFVHSLNKPEVNQPAHLRTCSGGGVVTFDDDAGRCSLRPRSSQSSTT
jgi:hypothetical protein